MSPRPSRRPVPRAIYWRRRLLLLATIIAIAWVATTVWPGGDDDPAPVAEPAPSTSTSAAAATPSPTPAATQAAQGDVQVSLTSSTEPCDPETVRITPTVPGDQPARGAVRVELLVSTTAPQGCTLDPDESEVVAVISSGDTAVWDSGVCDSALLDDPVSLSPGWSTTVPTAWSGRGSGPACSKKEGWASPGKYTLRIGTLGGEPGKASFRLAQPAPKPKATASASASAEPTASPKPTASPSPRTTTPTPAPDEE